ncbi:ATP-binding protein [Acidianus sp. HS-5]|uniref:ATP-binding protein n=1 Tax=Acidianus sp. HS-5 TaxID=2886040 RepID=UPI001F208D87|nr:ATP-binding protein [Acidianus sp. HS-5]BDC18545.1 ATPase [Acidianus sp. HS-5]
METFNNINPWWFYDNWEDKDKHLREWNSQKIKWVPEWIKEVGLEPFSLNFVYGTRQTGKTTGIKLLIREMIKRGKDPEEIYYLDLDYITSLSEFRKILEELIKEMKKRRKENGVVFLDEVTAIDEWWRILKYFIDSGEFQNAAITVTGSSLIGLTKIPEKFPGRRGKGKEIVVMPLSYPEFAEIKGKKTKEDLLFDTRLAYALFEEYLKLGGFPRSINEGPNSKETLIQSILSEIYRAGKRADLVQNIFYSLLDKIPSALSFNSIAGDIGVSHNTVEEYINFLIDLFLVDVAYLKRGDEIIKRKEKKVFFRDPFILQAVSWWVNKEFDKSALLENVVQEHLRRKVENVYYFKNSVEIDVIAGEYKIEIKSKRQHRSYPKDVKVLNEEEIPIFLLRV